MNIKKEKKKKKELILRGYLVDYDNYDRIKLMFLDNSDLSIINKFNEQSIHFTKDYITYKNKYYKNKNPNSYCPIIDEKYFYIKCRKNQKCEIEINRVQLHENELRIIKLINENEENSNSCIVQNEQNENDKKNKFIKINIKQAIQNYVECVVEVNEYNFEIKGNLKEGYNFKLKKINVI